MSPNKKKILLAFKVIFIIAALSIVFYNAETTQIKYYISNINPFLLYLAYAAYMVAQVTSAFRMKYYFKSEDVKLNNNYSVGVFFTGMLFNSILPGGITGDGYKAFSINKLSKFPVMSSIRLLISDRASGLYVLANVAMIFALISNSYLQIEHANLLIALVLVGLTPAYLLSIKIILRENFKKALGALPYSLVIQFSGVTCAYFLLLGLGVNPDEYQQISSCILLFLLSSVFSVIPISIGGIGIRELTFLYGSKFLGLNPELGVALAIIFFIINLICSLKGLLFWHRLEKLYNKNTGVINGST